MTQEEKARAYDEALERAKNMIDDLRKGEDILAVSELEAMFPDLRESEDERIRKALIEGVRQIRCKNGITQEQMIAYLEKQKINTEGDFGRGYDCGYEACLNSHGSEWFEKQKEKKPSCWNSPVMTNEMIMEKQKEQPKEELVYRLNGLMQDYIKEGKDDEEKEHRFKCYQLFWNALENTSYFEQKEQVQEVEDDLDKEIHRFFDDCIDVYEAKLYGSFSERVIPVDCYELIARHFAEWGERQKEQKPVEPSDEELQRHQDELYDFKVFAARQAREHHISFVHDFEWNNFCAELLSYFNEKQKPVAVNIKALLAADKLASAEMTGRLKERSEILENPEKYGLCKPVEWSEEEYGRLFDIEQYLHGTLQLSPDRKIACIDFLKSLRPSWKPSEEQMDSLRDTIVHTKGYSYSMYLPELYEQLKAIKEDRR